MPTDLVLEELAWGLEGSKARVGPSVHLFGGHPHTFVGKTFVSCWGFKNLPCVSPKKYPVLGTTLWWEKPRR